MNQENQITLQSKKFKVKTDVSESLPVGLAVLLERINRIKGRVTITN